MIRELLQHLDFKTDLCRVGGVGEVGGDDAVRWAMVRNLSAILEVFALDVIVLHVT